MRRHIQRQERLPDNLITGQGATCICSHYIFTHTFHGLSLSLSPLSSLNRIDSVRQKSPDEMRRENTTKEKKLGIIAGICFEFSSSSIFKHLFRANSLVIQTLELFRFAQVYFYGVRTSSCVDLLYILPHKTSRDFLKGRTTRGRRAGSSTHRGSRWIGEVLCTAEWIPSSHSTGARTPEAESRRHFARNSTPDFHPGGVSKPPGKARPPVSSPAPFSAPRRD